MTGETEQADGHVEAQAHSHVCAQACTLCTLTPGESEEHKDLQEWDQWDLPPPKAKTVLPGKDDWDSGVFPLKLWNRQQPVKGQHSLR